ncbi:hypothetical protein BDZ85DRAFT_1019 [Elsinoe ampelina]|uniref:Shugoshin n=1 Tax=Elsinoe ampelina TaxID=302913 RepID=A0A6A6GPD7_9PEZI|nr:hypothetical protein BDZ85DRAFT_1019 [Elsinoe ampelina]
MARLNEAPLPTESVDALKRRFIRQNRDLARINTHQSLRIRALEVEQSRLQSENLALREDIIRLQNQLTDSPDDIQLSDIDLIRQNLQQKVEEVLGVVSELGQYKKREQPKRQSDPSLWKPAIPNLRLAGPELRMPAIVEGKQYPRRTLDAEEIRALRLSDQSNESPDLGPPPVAHFDDVDPIKFDRPEPVRRESGGEVEVEEIPADMAINLETRRRRKDSQPRTSAAHVEEPSTQISDTKAAPIRTSTKRKLSVCDTEGPSIPQSSEPFNFTRRTSSSAELRRSASTEVMTSSPTKLDMTEWINEEAPRERRVLGDKSTNQSPRKILTTKKSSNSLAKDAVAQGVDVPKPRARRPKATSTLPVPVQVLPDPVEATTAAIDFPEPTAEDLPPKTPSLDLFSPTSAPSSSRPPSILTTANSEGMEGTTRPSRRARAAVSYAEPSLNTKMRRPTKDLVDAVTTSRNSISASKGSSSAPLIKKEDEDEDWRNMSSVGVEARSPSLLSREEGREAKESRIASPPASTRALACRLGRGERPRSVAEIRLSSGRDLADGSRDAPLNGFSGVSDTHRRTSSLEVRRTRRHSSVSSLGEVDLSGSSSPRVGSLEVSPVGDAGVQARPGISRSTSQPLGLAGRSERLASRRRSMVV